MKFTVAAFSLLALTEVAMAGVLEDRSYRWYRNRKQIKNGWGNVQNNLGATKTVLGVSTETTTTTETVFVTVGGDHPQQPVQTPIITDDGEDDFDFDTDPSVVAPTQVAPPQNNPPQNVPHVTKTVVYTSPVTVTETRQGQEHVNTRVVTITSLETVEETRTVEQTNTVQETISTTSFAINTIATPPPGGNNNNNNNNGGNNGGNNNDTETETQTDDADVIATETSSADNGEPTENPGNEDPQTSLTVDPRVIQSNLANNGQPEGGANDGQVPSLTSTNNFINFCLTQNVALTDGKQIREGSCNVVPMGRIIAKDLIPSAKFVAPRNFGTVPANQAFDIQLKLRNFQSGAFTNAAATYYGAPCQVNGQGIVIGHSHVVIEQLASIESTDPADPTRFAFFKGLNDPADGNGILSTSVTAGLAPGAYRLFSINTCSNHQPVLASVAQHGSMDDGIYFTAV